jgi:hypothetical protein
MLSGSPPIDFYIIENDYSAEDRDEKIETFDMLMERLKILEKSIEESMKCMQKTQKTLKPTLSKNVTEIMKCEKCEAWKKIVEEKEIEKQKLAEEWENEKEMMKQEIETLKSEITNLRALSIQELNRELRRGNPVKFVPFRFDQTLGIRTGIQMFGAKKEF